MLMTETELSDIASAAITGLSRTPKTGYKRPAAIGTPMPLCTKARKRFCRMLHIVAWLNARARDSCEISFDKRNFRTLYTNVCAGSHGDPDVCFR